MVNVTINIVINMDSRHTQAAALDELSFSDSEDLQYNRGAGGPADDIIPAGRVYCYSTDDSDSGGQEVPLHQRIKRSRFVSRIQEERIHIQAEKLDMEQFQPMMTSETIKDLKSKMPRSVKLRHNRRQAKRECEDDWHDQSSVILRKRDRKESDYGSLGSLGSELLKLDIEQDPKLESKFRERPSKLLSDCLNYRRTMTQLRRQTLHLVKDIDEAKKRVEESYVETEKLKTEYDKMSQETQDMISHLKFARSKIKSVIKRKK